MRTALAIVAVLLALESFAGFQSEFCDTGDFPISSWTPTTVLQPKLKDKYAIVAMCAALGELRNGMRMRFDVYAPLDGTPLAPWASLVTQAMGGELNRELVEGEMLAAQVAAVCDLYGRGYGGTYGGVKMLGIVTNMNFAVGVGDAASVAFDMSNAAYSNMKAQFDVDYALFRALGPQSTSKSASIRNAIKSAYSRVFGTRIGDGIGGAVCLENGITGYGFDPSPWGEQPTSAALDTAFWKVGIIDSGMETNSAYAYRQLYYAPMTWYNAPWAPQNVGMMFEFATNCVAIETRVRKVETEGTIRVTRTVSDDSVEFNFSLSGVAAGETLTYTTNYVPITQTARLESTLNVDDVRADGVTLYYANVNYDYDPPRLLVHGEPYQVTTNGYTFWCHKMHAMPCAWTNTAGYLDVPVKYSVVTTNQRFVASAQIDDTFPSDHGYLKGQMLSAVSCDGWAFDDSRMLVETNGVVTYEGAPLGMKTCVTAKLIQAMMAHVGTNVFAEIAKQHDYYPIFGGIVGETTLLRLNEDDEGYPFDPDEVHVWETKDPVSGELYNYLGHTKDFVTFSRQQLFSVYGGGPYPFIDDEPLTHWSRSHYGEKNWSLSAEVDMAVFGFWRFTRWAHK